MNCGLNSRHRIAAVQMISGENIAANLESAARLVGFAAEQGATLVLLPEYFAVLSADETLKLRHAEPAGDGPLQRFLAELAREHAVTLVGGTIPIVTADPTRVRNACLVYGVDGKQLARYDKLHLFNLNLGAESFCEARTIEPGDKPIALDTPAGRVALSVCYDLRFAELYRRLLPFDILCMPAAFTATTGRAHWEVLLRARAIENQCYVLASAQGGVHPGGRCTYGHSMIVDPWGEVLEVLPEGAGVVIADADPARLAQVRRDLPALANRVLD